MFKSQNYIEVASYILGVIGTLLLLCGGLVVYIFTRHVSDNEREFDKVYTQLDRKQDKRK